MVSSNNGLVFNALMSRNWAFFNIKFVQGNFFKVS